MSVFNNIKPLVLKGGISHFPESEIRYFFSHMTHPYNTRYPHYSISKFVCLFISMEYQCEIIDFILFESILRLEEG